MSLNLQTTKSPPLLKNFRENILALAEELQAPRRSEELTLLCSY